MKEFELIKKYFQDKTSTDPQTLLGIGDDAAILKLSPNEQLVVSVDTIVSGVHFLPDTPAVAIAYLALAVNLSDMAAMGATPKWFTLALTLPNASEQWLSEFSAGLFDLASEYNIELIGGDTTQGPLTVTIQIMGTLTDNKALLRTGAKVGDKVYVSGYLGDAGLGLEMLQGKRDVPETYREYLKNRYQYPAPRVKFAQSLLNIANSAIDISDGLAADLNHILERSGLGATIFSSQLPMSEALKKSVNPEDALYLALAAGGDYELCFTISAEYEKDLERLSQALTLPCACIGEVKAGAGLEIMDEHNRVIPVTSLGWEHFV